MNKSPWAIISLIMLTVTFRSYASPDMDCPSCDLVVRANVFEFPGKLVFDRVQGAQSYRIEWAPSADGPWTNFTGGMGAWLDDIPAAGAGAITASVPMFYRVRAWVNTNTWPDPDVMSYIPAGEFVMGDAYGDGSTSERPLHTNVISAFYMDKYEVTKALWDEVKDFNSGNGYGYWNTGEGKDTNHPVHTVNWYDVVKWCNARSEMEGLAPVYYTDAGFTTVYKTGEIPPFANWSANGYRLPTEAEWEKAARGGVAGQRFPWGDTITHSNANYISWEGYDYDTSSTRGEHPTFNDGNPPYTSPVGYFAPNGYGLYDMAGNVQEWCWDFYSSNYYSSSPSDDPRGPSSGFSRVLRDGSWSFDAPYTRVTWRRPYNPERGADDSTGFRCARSF